MLIRYGYEITLTCQQPTAVVCLLSVHEDRAANIRAAETFFTTPDVPTSTYRDLFGNRCRRLVAPAGDLMIWGDATIDDDGRPDPVFPDARELPVPELPDDTLVYLLGSRYCETDRLSQIAWDMFGTGRARLGSRAGGLRLRAQSHPLRLYAGPCDAVGLRNLP